MNIKNERLYPAAHFFIGMFSPPGKAASSLSSAIPAPD